MMHDVLRCDAPSVKPPWPLAGALIVALFSGACAAEPTWDTNSSGKKVAVIPWGHVGEATRTAYAPLRVGGAKGDFRVFRWRHTPKKGAGSHRGVTIQKRETKEKPFKPLLDFCTKGVYYWHDKSCVMDIDGDGTDEILICKTYGTSALPTLEVFRFAEGRVVNLTPRRLLFREITWNDVDGDGSKELVLREELDRHRTLYGFWFVVGPLTKNEVGFRFDARYLPFYQKEEKRLLELAQRTKHLLTKLDCLTAVAKKNKLVSEWYQRQSARQWKRAAEAARKAGYEDLARVLERRAARMGQSKQEARKKGATPRRR